jgi:NitT/TauT family transport system substrate-binding protein
MRLWLLAATTMVLTGCGSSPHPQTANVRIAVGGRAALDYIPVYLASSLGFFREEGLDVTLQDLAGGAKAMQSLLGGSSDVVAGAYDAAVGMTIKGQPIQAIAILERWPPMVVVATRRSGRELRTLRDLKGASVGVSSPGSSTHRLINYLLRKNGMSLSDISPVGVGVNFTMVAALQHGQVDAAVAGPLGMALLANNPNLTTLADCRTPEGARQTLGTANLPFTALMTRPQWARANPGTTRKLGQAVRRALGWIHTHSAEDVCNAMPREYKGQDAAMYLRAVRDILPAFSADGLMPDDGPANVKAFLDVSDESARDANIDLKATYTNEFVQAR